MDARNCSQLFVEDDGLPMEFVMRTCQARAEIKTLVEQHGGVFRWKGGKNVFRIADPAGQFCYDDKDRVISAQFVYDTVEQNRRLDTEFYIMESKPEPEIIIPDSVCYPMETDVPTEGINDFNDKQIIEYIFANQHYFINLSRPNFLKKLKADQGVVFPSSKEFTNKIRQILQYIDSYNLTVEEIKHFKNMCALKNLLPFYKSDDMKILNYIVNNNSYEYVKGSELWEEMAVNKVTDHSAKSMCVRFHHTILPNLDKYHLSPSKLKRLQSNTKIMHSDVDSDIEKEVNMPISAKKIKQQLKKKLSVISKNSRKIRTVGDDEQVQTKSEHQKSNEVTDKAFLKDDMLISNRSSEESDSLSFLEKENQGKSDKNVKKSRLIFIPHKLNRNASLVAFKLYRVPADSPENNFKRGFDPKTQNVSIDDLRKTLEFKLSPEINDIKNNVKQESDVSSLHQNELPSHSSSDSESTEIDYSLNDYKPTFEIMPANQNISVSDFCDNNSEPTNQISNICPDVNIEKNNLNSNHDVCFNDAYDSETTEIDSSISDVETDTDKNVHDSDMQIPVKCDKSSEGSGIQTDGNIRPLTLENVCNNSLNERLKIANSETSEAIKDTDNIKLEIDEDCGIRDFSVDFYPKTLCSNGFKILGPNFETNVCDFHENDSEETECYDSDNNDVKDEIKVEPDTAEKKDFSAVGLHETSKSKIVDKNFILPSQLDLKIPGTELKNKSKTAVQDSDNYWMEVNDSAEVTDHMYDKHVIDYIFANKHCFLNRSIPSFLKKLESDKGIVFSSPREFTSKIRHILQYIDSYDVPVERAQNLKNMCVSKNLVPFYKSDDMKILSYIINNDSYKHVKGLDLWEEMRINKVTDHSAKSMYIRFHLTILPNLDKYHLSPSKLKKLQNILNATLDGSMKKDLDLPISAKKIKLQLQEKLSTPNRKDTEIHKSDDQMQIESDLFCESVINSEGLICPKKAQVKQPYDELSYSNISSGESSSNFDHIISKKIASTPCEFSLNDSLGISKSSINQINFSCYVDHQPLDKNVSTNSLSNKSEFKFGPDVNDIQRNVKIEPGSMESNPVNAHCINSVNLGTIYSNTVTNIQPEIDAATAIQIVPIISSDKTLKFHDSSENSDIHSNVKVELSNTEHAFANNPLHPENMSSIPKYIEASVEEDSSCDGVPKTSEFNSNSETKVFQNDVELSVAHILQDNSFHELCKHTNSKTEEINIVAPVVNFSIRGTQEIQDFTVDHQYDQLNSDYCDTVSIKCPLNSQGFEKSNSQSRLNLCNSNETYSQIKTEPGTSQDIIHNVSIVGLRQTLKSKLIKFDDIHHSASFTSNESIVERVPPVFYRMKLETAPKLKTRLVSDICNITMLEEFKNSESYE